VWFEVFQGFLNDNKALDTKRVAGHSGSQAPKVMQTFRFALPASTGDSGTPRLASRLFTDAASAQPAPPSMNAMAGYEPLRPRLPPVGAWMDLARTSHYLVWLGSAVFLPA